MTNGHNYSERVRHILSNAQSEADQTGQEYVAPEHILLAMLKEPDGVASGALQDMQVDVESVREQVEERVAHVQAATPLGDVVPFSDAAKAVLERTAAKARSEGGYIGTEHLLLGLLESDGTATAAILKGQGLTAERVTAETMRIPGVVARAD